MKKCLMLAGILLFFALFGFLLLVLVYAIPVSGMISNIRESAAIFREEGAYPQIIQGYKTTQLDNYTDALMLSGAISTGSGNIIEDAIYVNHLNVEEWGPVATLLHYIERPEEEHRDLEISYPRYWHGYLIILKPLLVFLDFAGIRVLNMICQTICLMVLFKLWMERNLKKYILGFGLSILFLHPIMTALSLQFTSCFYIIVFSCIFLLKFSALLIDHEKRFVFHSVIYFFVIGILTAYFDLLTYPIATLGIPLTLFLILYQENPAHSGKQLQLVILLSFSWAGGYAGMWGSKLILGSLITGSNLWTEAYGEFQYMAGMDMDKHDSVALILSGLQKCFQILLRKPYIISFIAATFICLGKAVKEKRSRFKPYDTLPYLLIGLLPLVHVLAGTHMNLHYWFSFREFSITLFAYFCILAVNTSANGQTGKGISF